MKTDALTNPIVRAAIEALQNGNRKTWSALFEPDAELYDDGSPRSLKEFTREGHLAVREALVLVHSWCTLACEWG